MRFSRQGEVLQVQVPAKINLSLKVLGRRTDGYHDLQTLMVSVALYDTLTFSAAPPTRVSLRILSSVPATASLPTDDRNLVVKAARLLQSETKAQSGVEIALWKRIPSEAGLGGGSSDAAATLVGLNRFWGLNLPAVRLHELAAELGSDVNFFLDSSLLSHCTGRGEQIEEVQLPRPLHAVIIKPPAGLSTGRVFQAWGALRTSSWEVSRQTCERVNQKIPETSLPEARPFSEWRTVRDWQLGLQNDLERPARTLNPELDRLLRRLHQLDVIGSGMTGSGSACFALCRTVRQARVIAGRCRHWNAGQVFVVSTGV